MTKHIAITACPYSATNFTALLLRRYGLHIGHEVYREEGVVSWGHIHMTKAEFIRDGFSQDMTLLHQLRHPLMVISSLRAIHNGSQWPPTGEYIWGMIKRMTHHMGADWDIDNEPPPDDRHRHLLPWMKLWYHWNVAGATKADGVYRIEELETRWPWFRERLGMGDVEYIRTNTKINRKKTSLMRSWDDMYAEDADLTLKIIDLAESYGYTQTPIGYLADEFYTFPEQIELSEVTV